MDDDYWNSGNGSFNFTENDEFCEIFLGSIVPWSLTVFMCLTVTGATANGLLLFAIYKDPLKCFRTPTTYFIMNLATADLLNACYHIEELLVSQTKYNSSICLPGFWGTFHSALGSFVYFLPFPSVAVLALERYVSVAHPLWHQVKVTSQLCRVAIIVIWTVNCLFTAISVILPDIIEIITGYPSVFYITTACIYFMAFISIRKQRLSLATDNSKSESVKRTMKTRLKHQNRFLTTVLIINVILIFGIIPVTIAAHWKNMSEETMSASTVVLFYIADILYFINMAANPFLYVWRLPKYRKTFSVIYCCKK